MTQRLASLQRKTSETSVEVTVDLDGTGRSKVRTGLPFLDHMVTALSKHSHIDIELSCAGDLEVDDHHSVEDCALALGAAIDQALGTRSGVARFGHAYAPLDEALARVVVDLSGRPFAAVDLALCRPMIGTVASENLTHFLRSFAVASRSTLHVKVLEGDNDHHRVEAAFKALALALKQAVSSSGGPAVPSTKGVL